MIEPTFIDVDNFRDEVDLTADPITIDLTEDTVIDISNEDDDPLVGQPNIMKVEEKLATASTYTHVSVGQPSRFVTLAGAQRRSLNVAGPSSQVHSRKRLAGAMLVGVDEPAPKRWKFQDNTPAPSSMAGITNQVHVLELDSDGDDVEILAYKGRTDGDATDSEEEYSNLHDGLELNNPDTWKPWKVQDDDNATDAVEQPTIANLNVTVDKPIYVPDVSITRRPRKLEKVFIWDALRMAINNPHRYEKRVGSTRRDIWDFQITPHWLPRIESMYDRPKKLTTSFKRAPGSINKVAQKEGAVVICSASMGGQPDGNNDEPRNPYNREGALMVWHQNLPQNLPRSLPGHQRKVTGLPKYYAVNDIKFDPLSDCFISTGNDKRAQIWSRNSEDEGYELCDTYDYRTAPHDIAFQTGGSAHAVGTRAVHIYSGLDDEVTSTDLELVNNNHVRNRNYHNVGAMGWGNGLTASLLFASSEPIIGFDGFHKAFDLNTFAAVFSLDAKEAGDAMGIEPKGDSLALATRGSDSQHVFRIYDIRRKESTAVTTFALDPFPTGTEGEVNQITFSPDGIYMALARNDNYTQVYDTRMIHRAPIYNFRHQGQSRVNPGHDSYGIVQAQWTNISFKRIGLITGGNDGCVRRWDPLVSSDDRNNGTILAEANSDIGHFCLGDRFEKEHDLVVGDCSGEVYIFDGITSM